MNQKQINKFKKFLLEKEKMTQPFTYVQFEEDRLHSVRAFV